MFVTVSCCYFFSPLRVSYVFCDPVLACITVLPVLLLRRLPLHINDLQCLDEQQNHVNFSVASCLNISISDDLKTQLESSGDVFFLRQQRVNILINILTWLD